MMRNTSLLCFIMLYCCSASIALADIDIEETFTHYDINPKKASDIVFELRERSPVRKNNRTFHGSAEWELRPLFQWKRIGKLCYVEDFSVKVKTEYTMPQLASGKSFDESVKVKFDKFYDALLVHEKGHSEFGIKAANEIYQLLDNVKPVQGCKVLKKRVTRDINEIIETYDKLNQAYDVETGHGRTQGAVIS